MGMIDPRTPVLVGVAQSVDRTSAPGAGLSPQEMMAAVARAAIADSGATIERVLLTHGHLGYSKDLPHQQRMRDVLGLQIGDGTAQVSKMIIARETVGRASVQYARK